MQWWTVELPAACFQRRGGADLARGERLIHVAWTLHRAREQMLPTRALDVVHAEPIEDRRAMRTGRQPRLLRALHGGQALHQETCRVDSC